MLLTASKLTPKGSEKIEPVGSLQKETAKEISKQMAFEKEGIDFKSEPQKLVNLVLPPNTPKLSIIGNTIESVTEGIITAAIPTKRINNLNIEAAEQITLTLQSQGREEELDATATEKIGQGKVTMLLKEPVDKVDFLQCEVILDKFNTETLFQARGSLLPSWFPGYFVSFPDEITILPVRSPSAVLLKAWQKLKPEYITV